MALRFVSPWVLAGIPLALAAIVWGHRQSYVNFTPGRRRALLALRAALMVTLLTALSQPAFVGRSSHPPLVLLVDVSDSVPDRALEAVRAQARELWQARGGQRMELVTFGAHARRAATLPEGPRIERHDGEGTSYSEALAVARGLFPGERARLVMFTDGHGGHEEAFKAARLANREGFVLDLVPLPEAPRDARVSGIVAPDTLRQQEATRLTVAIESTVAGSATLVIDENGLALQRIPDLALTPGRQTFDVEVVPSTAGLLRYGAQISLTGDELPKNDRFVRVLSVAGPPRVLVVPSTPEEGAHLEETLRAQDLYVEEASPSSLPSSLEGLLSYDAVVLAGVAPWELTRLRQDALASHVRDTGAGLLFVSGRGGLRHSPDRVPSALEPILPVTQASPSEQTDPSVGIVLLIDRSGSMVGDKLGFAKQAALAVVDRLTAKDQIGVITFDAGFDWLVPLSAVDDKDRIKKMISEIAGGGGTRFYPALEEAFFNLGSSDTTIRHVVLLTDGVSTDPNIFPALLAKMRASSITVSTVAIGREADTKLLTQIAQLGGGRYSFTDSANEVPNIFVKETETIQRDAAQHTESRVRVAMASRELAGIDFKAAPPLLGYVRAKAKANSEVLLEVGARDPLLVRWPYGLGRVAAFCSDASTAWSQRWLTDRWPGYGKLWTQLIRSVLRARSSNDLRLTFRPEGEGARLELEAVDLQGRFIHDLTPLVTLLDEASGSRDVELVQSGPGFYATTLRELRGSLIGRPSAAVGGRRIEGAWAVLDRPYPAELAQVGNDAPTLAALAGAGGGAVLPRPADALASTTPLPATTHLLVHLAGLALALFLADLVVKRARLERGS